MVLNEAEAAHHFVSWAKSAADLRRISRSVLNSAFSLHSRANSTPTDTSAVPRDCYSPSLLRTQYRNVSWLTPNSRTPQANERPDERTNSTTSLNSAGYFHVPNADSLKVSTLKGQDRGSQDVWPAIFTNQFTPNLSVHMPKVSPHGAVPSGIPTVPLSDNLFQ